MSDWSCPWCVVPYLCMHGTLNEEEECARFAEFAQRAGIPVLPVEADSEPS